VSHTQILSNHICYCFSSEDAPSTEMSPQPYHYSPKHQMLSSSSLNSPASSLYTLKSMEICITHISQLSLLLFINWLTKTLGLHTVFDAYIHPSFSYFITAYLWFNPIYKQVGVTRISQSKTHQLLSDLSLQHRILLFTQTGFKSHTQDSRRHLALHQAWSHTTARIWTSPVLLGFTTPEPSYTSHTMHHSSSHSIGNA
jgi:hypothetical protein